MHCDLHIPDHILLTDSGAGVVFINFHSAVPEEDLRPHEMMKDMTDGDTSRLLWHVPECGAAHKRMIGRWFRGRDMLKMVPDAFFLNYNISDEGPETERNEYEAMKALAVSGQLDKD